MIKIYSRISEGCSDETAIIFGCLSGGVKVYRIRLDARGNKAGVDAQFSIDEERLVFPIREHFGEREYLLNYSEPHPKIIETLEAYSNCIEMYQGGLPQEL